MDKEQNASRVAAISSAYRGRAEAVRAGADREKKREEAEKQAVNKRRTEADEKAETPEELPKESWKKDDIIDWLLDNGVEAERPDLEGQTKAELLDNFVDEG